VLTASAAAGPWPASAGAPVAGDTDCNGQITSRDSQALLRFVLGQAPLTQTEPCTDVGVSGWGDWDCNGSVGARDNQALLRFVLGQAPLSQTEPCADIGSPLGGQVVLNEVLFSPTQGQGEFVELHNPGAAPASLSGLALVNQDGITNNLSGVPDVPAGGYMHTGGGNLVTPGSGWIELRRGSEVLDRVAWGDEPDAARTTLGGVDQGLAPGTSINRAEGTTASGWMNWYPAAPTSSAPNEPPDAPAFPLDGAISSQGDVVLAWYAAPGATAYLVEVSDEPTVTPPLVNGTVTAATRLELPLLGAGLYYWRVTSLFTSGASSASPVQTLVVTSGGVQGDTQVTIDVPFIQPRKDTDMLLLESTQVSGEHRWDRAHSDFDPDDPAEADSALLAAIAMINEHYLGSLSQDRIAYEIFKDRFNGPERDLAFADAIPLDGALLAIATLIGDVNQTCSTDAETIWAAITASANAGAPLVAIANDHAVVIRGYAQRTPGGGPAIPERSVYVNDPLIGPYEADFFKQGFSCVITLPVDSLGAYDEPELATDNDADGVVDFDEINRFHTHPGDADTDNDGLSDKGDIASTLFDPEHGYAFDFFHDDFGGTAAGFLPAGRDWDRDGARNELDCDSDNDGAKDSEDPDGFSTAGISATCGGFALLTWHADSDYDLYLLPGPASSWEATFPMIGSPGYALDEAADCLLDPSDTQRSALLEITSAATTHVAVFFWSGCPNDPDGPEGDGPDTVTFNLFVQRPDGTSFQRSETLTKETDSWRVYPLVPPPEP
jgi:hypothetical protein